MIKRWFTGILVLATLLSSLGAVSVSAVAAPSLSAESAVLIATDKKNPPLTVYEKNAHRKMGMASTTKIMTALVALSLMPTDTKITVSPEAVGIEGSSVYLVAGEVLTLEELIYALLLSSANDAAAAIAIGVSGSLEAFVEKMNERAEEMGLTSTHFVNPHGLYDDEHYTTAYELALITDEAMKVELIAKAVSTYKTTIPHPSAEGGRLLVNHNKLLKSYDSAIGVKTGFTKKTGRCLVSAAEREGLTLIAVTLNAPSDWSDHTQMHNFGFENYELSTLFDVGEFSYELPAVGGTVPSVTLTNSEPISLIMKKGQDMASIELSVYSTGRFVFAPMSAGYEAATLCAELGTSRSLSALLTKEELKATEDKKESLLSRFFGRN